jgi:hypothetical protein
LALGNKIADKRIAGGIADAFADAVGKPCGEDERGCRRDGKERFGEGGEPIADDGEHLALAEPVAQPARKELADRGG